MVGSGGLLEPLRVVVSPDVGSASRRCSAGTTASFAGVASGVAHAVARRSDHRSGRLRGSGRGRWHRDPALLRLWFLMPGPGGELHGRNPARTTRPRERDLRQPLAIGLIVAGVRAPVAQRRPVVQRPRRCGRSRSRDSVRSDVGSLGRGRAGPAHASRGPAAAGVVGGRQGVVRLAIGAVLVFSGIGAFLAANDALGAARQVGLAIVVTIAGLAVILGPWIRRLLTELTDERRERYPVGGEG